MNNTLNNNITFERYKLSGKPINRNPNPNLNSIRSYDKHPKKVSYANSTLINTQN